MYFTYNIFYLMLTCIHISYYYIILCTDVVLHTRSRYNISSSQFALVFLSLEAASKYKEKMRIIIGKKGIANIKNRRVRMRETVIIFYEVDLVIKKTTCWCSSCKKRDNSIYQIKGKLVRKQFMAYFKTLWSLSITKRKTSLPMQKIIILCARPMNVIEIS